MATTNEEEPKLKHWIGILLVILITLGIGAIILGIGAIAPSLLALL